MTASLSGLRESVGRLAAPAERQIDYLVALGVADLVDELALEFDDRYQPLRADLERRSDEAAAACAALDRALSSPELGWRFRDLHSPPWEDVRALATTAVVYLRRLEKTRGSGR
jgi:hypothetical protein